MGILIVIISAILYLIGGQWWKPARWGMGLVIPLFVLPYNIWNFVLCSVTYFLATSAVPYGEKSWLNKFVGERMKFLICGIAFGCASIPILGYIGILQGIISGLAFLLLKILDDKDIIKNPAVELLRGGLGTCLLIFN